MNTNVLEVSELSVSFLVDEEYIKCVRNVSFTVKAGECLAIVGESGCGKSVTAKSVMGLINKTARLVKTVEFCLKMKIC